MRDNQKRTLVGALVVLGVAVMLILRNISGDSSSIDSKWMYDLVHDQLVVVDIGEVSPSEKNGESFDVPGIGTSGSLIEVGIYSCGDLEDVREGMSISDLEAVDARIAYHARTVGDAREVAAPGSGEWFSEFSGPGIDLVYKAERSCPGGAKAYYSIP